MQQFLNRSAFLKVRVDEGVLFFTAKKVTEITDTHITFIDKFDELQTFLISDIIQIREVRHDRGNQR